LSVKKLDRNALNAWVDALMKKQKVFGVKAKGDRFAFGPLSEAGELRLDYDVTILPPKKYFLPQTEALLRFRTGAQGTFEEVMETEPFVLFGVHPYDFVAIQQMDAIFSKDHYDAHYMAKRANATIVVCDVQRPSENVFAGCMNTATVKDGFDALVTWVGDGYVVEAATEKGEALLGAAPGAADASAADLEAREKVWKDNENALRKHELKCKPEDLPELLEKSYKHPLWAERAERCHSCGSCNLVCPTCYCFDVHDDVDWDLASGRRIRRWDGCMLQEFAAVAGGHNFREEKAQRYRHRFYRKGKYLWDRMGQIACVGCGRCITACTTKIANPTEVYNALLEDRS